MKEKVTKEGYVIEVRFKDAITYVSNVQRRGDWVVNCNLTKETIPANAELFATKEEATQLRDKIRRDYSKKDFGFTYKIRFVRISIFYEFPKF